MHFVTITVTKPGPLLIRLKFDSKKGHAKLYGFDKTIEGKSGQLEDEAKVEIGDILFSVNNQSAINKTSFNEIINILSEVSKCDQVRVLIFMKNLLHSDDLSWPLQLREPQLQDNHQIIMQKVENNIFKNNENDFDENADINFFSDTERYQILWKMLKFNSKDIINIPKLRKIASYGIPDKEKNKSGETVREELRPVIWRILLRYLSPDKRSWKEFTSRQRQVYHQHASELLQPLYTYDVLHPGSLMLNIDHPILHPPSPLISPSSSSIITITDSGDKMQEHFDDSVCKTQYPKDDSETLDTTPDTIPNATPGESSRPGTFQENIPLSSNTQILTDPKFHLYKSEMNNGQNDNSNSQRENEVESVVMETLTSSSSSSSSSSSKCSEYDPEADINESSKLFATCLDNNNNNNNNNKLVMSNEVAGHIINSHCNNDSGDSSRSHHLVSNANNDMDNINININKSDSDIGNNNDVYTKNIDKANNNNNNNNNNQLGISIPCLFTEIETLPSPPPPPLSSSSASSSPNGSYSTPPSSCYPDTLHSDVLLFDEIQKDVIRTYPEMKFFADNDYAQQKILQKILYVFAKLNQGVRYVQGMNEIVGTLYYVLANDEDLEWRVHAEADTFYCFSTLLNEIKDLFIRAMDATDSGIHGRIQEFIDVLASHDRDLVDRILGQGLDPTFFSLRWVTTLMSREFDLLDTIRLWDSYFAAEDKHKFMTYLCCSMVLQVRSQLMEGDFADNLRLLQSYPPTDVRILLDQALSLQSQDIANNSLTGAGSPPTPLQRFQKEILPPTRALLVAVDAAMTSAVDKSEEVVNQWMPIVSSAMSRLVLQTSSNVMNFMNKVDSILADNLNDPKAVDYVDDDTTTSTTIMKNRNSSEKMNTGNHSPGNRSDIEERGGGGMSPIKILRRKSFVR